MWVSDVGVLGSYELYYISARNQSQVSALNICVILLRQKLSLGIPVIWVTKCFKLSKLRIRKSFNFHNKHVLTKCAKR